MYGKTLNLKLPKVFKPFLFKHFRYKIVYGGRAGTKSWTFAMAAILMAKQHRVRILCTREIQKSIKDSVYRLLIDLITQMGLQSEFAITQNSIVHHRNRSEFIFLGLSRNVEQIKSLEGVDVCWTEEAETITDNSWDLLIPTIRKTKDKKFRTPKEYNDFLSQQPGLQFPEYLDEKNLTIKIPAEIWVSFNPRFEVDPTYQRFVINQPSNAYVVKTSWRDNPCLPATLKKEMEDCKKLDEATYLHIWEGVPTGGGSRVWDKFDKDIHTRDIDVRKEGLNANYFMAMDPHSKYYPFILWMAIFPKNDRQDEFYKVVFDEYPNFDRIGGYYADLREKLKFNDTLQELSKEIFARENGISITGRYIDTRFAKGAGGENWSTATTGLVQEFARPENGSLQFFLPHEKMIDIQRDRISSDLSYNKLAEITPMNEPDLYVTSNCKNLIQSLRFHHFETDSEKQNPKYKDASDALRILYAGTMDFSWSDPNKKGYAGPSMRGMDWMGV